MGLIGPKLGDRNLTPAEIEIVRAKVERLTMREVLGFYITRWRTERAVRRARKQEAPRHAPRPAPRPQPRHLPRSA